MTAVTLAPHTHPGTRPLPDSPAHPRLRAGTIALCRGEGELQFGISDDLAVTVRLPRGVRAPDAVAALHRLDGETPVAAALAAVGVAEAPEAFSRVVDLLAEHGVLERGVGEDVGVGGGSGVDTIDGGGAVGGGMGETGAGSGHQSPGSHRGHRPGVRARTERATVVHVLGRGDMARRIEAPLRQSGFAYGWSERKGLDLSLERPPWRGRVSAPPLPGPESCVAAGGADAEPRATVGHSGGFSSRHAPADIVVLADDIVPDPVVTTALHRCRTPHLYLACRDGRVVVGPTVVPGRSSCLRCADLYRTDRNPEWPRVSAQLLFTSGWAPVPSRVAAAALVLSEVEKLREHGPEAMVTYGHTVEISVAEGIWRKRHWEPHPGCGCGA